MTSAIVTAVVSFVSTNIDDIFVLMVFFSQIGTQLKKHHIIIGQYIGISILLIISILGSVGLNIVPQQYTGLLGIVPIILGIKVWLEHKQESVDSSTQAILEAQAETGSETIVRNRIQGSNTEIDIQTPEQSRLKSALSKVMNPAILNVSLVTIANGADNIGIYIPLFTRLNTLELFVTLVIFLLLIAVWCFVGERLTNFPGVKPTIERYKNIVVPIVFIGIGTFILVESNVLVYLVTFLK